MTNGTASRLVQFEWEVVFVDATDVRYGPYTVPLSECGDTALTVLPEDAS